MKLNKVVNKQFLCKLNSKEMARAAGPGTLTRVYHLSKNYIFKYVFWVIKKVTKSNLSYSSGHVYSLKFHLW